MAGLAGWPMVVAAWKGPGWRRAFGFVASGRAVWMGIVGGIATFLTLVILTAIASVVFGQTIDSAAADLVVDMESQTVAYAIFLVFIAFGAPFVEEMAFRGLLWGAIVKRGWSPWVATLVSGVAFGLFHFEPLRLVPLIAAGVVLGFVRHKAGLGRRDAGPLRRQLDRCDLVAGDLSGQEGAAKPPLGGDSSGLGAQSVWRCRRGIGECCDVRPSSPFRQHRVQVALGRHAGRRWGGHPLSHLGGQGRRERAARIRARDRERARGTVGRSARSPRRVVRGRAWPPTGRAAGREPD